MVDTPTAELHVWEEIETLTDAVKAAAANLAPAEARVLVDSYYEIQEYRKGAANQVAAMGRQDEGTPVLSGWLATNFHVMERNIARTLQAYAEGHQVGTWALSITGIGPVISAGLLASIDIEQAPTVGHIWRFAGLDPTVTWEKGEKRPWNARLKTLCWKIGESFVKVSNKPTDFYGKVYVERKAFENRRNEAGELADQAEAKLKRFNIGKDTEAYKWYSGQMAPPGVDRFRTLPASSAQRAEGLLTMGMLPPAHIHARAKRYAVKLFLAHWQHVAYVVKYGTEPPKPYIIEHGGHTHFIAPPNWPIDA